MDMPVVLLCAALLSAEPADEFSSPPLVPAAPTQAATDFSAPPLVVTEPSAPAAAPAVPPQNAAAAQNAAAYAAQQNAAREDAEARAAEQNAEAENATNDGVAPPAATRPPASAVAQQAPSQQPYGGRPPPPTPPPPYGGRPPPPPGSYAAQPPPPADDPPRTYAPRSADAETSRSAPERSSSDSDVPVWGVTALGTAIVPTSFDGAEYAVGFRGEVDVFRFSGIVSLDRTLTVPFEVHEQQSWNGLFGYSVAYSRYARLRLLGGVSVLSESRGTWFAPTAGATARLGLSFISIEASALMTPFPYRQFDGRLEAVLRAGVFELHAGYRARFLDTSDGGGLGTLFAQAPMAGPSVALGLSF